MRLFYPAGLAGRHRASRKDAKKNKSASRKERQDAKKSIKALLYKSFLLFLASWRSLRETAFYCFTAAASEPRNAR
jgi:hypothetical protein